MHFTSKLSTHSDLETALGEVASATLLEMRGARPDIAFLFIGGYLVSEVENAGRRIRELSGARFLIGCTAGGVVGGGREVEHRASVALTLASMPNVNIQPFHVLENKYPSEDAPPADWHRAIGVDPIDAAGASPTLILLPDPFTSDAQRLIDGLNYAYSKSVKIGGLASAGNEGMNRLFLNDASLREGTTGVALSGAIEVETVVAQGCKPVGGAGKITKAQRFFLMEVDGKPAIDFIQAQVDSFTNEERELARTALFLGIVMDPFRDREPSQGDYLIRNIMGVDRERGYVAIGAQLSIGRTVQLHVRDRQTSMDDLLAVLRRTRAGTAGAPAGALLFSCLGRGRNLYGEPDKDSKLFKSVVGDVPLGGFFCNGEIGPVSGETYIHGFTSSFGLFKTPADIRT
ncbi:MAG: FIST C-terminal domain-containing protein [Planctomycetes bacterium]|nr:FIST C-terminal domain-containing protein [Planctomycetota bacterium]